MKKVALVHSADSVSAAKLEVHPERERLVMDLIKSYGLLKAPTVEVVRPEAATRDRICEFHAADYVDALFSDGEPTADVLETYGLVDDCVFRPGIGQATAMVVGATLTGLDVVLDPSRPDVALCWTGGRHHAARAKADGFCFANDVVLALLALQRAGKRALYIDLDVHHPDAVEDAFAFTDAVVTMSIHKFSTGFYPGTGKLDERGKGRGKDAIVNLPMRDGLTDATFLELFRDVSAQVLKTFKPEVVVLQMGADGLALDPLGGFNLTPAGYVGALRNVLAWDLPTLVLGGGGYHEANTARLWTMLTAEAAGVDLEDDIPSACKNFDVFGPTFRLTPEPAFGIRDENSPEYVEDVRSTLIRRLRKRQLRQRKEAEEKAARAARAAEAKAARAAKPAALAVDGTNENAPDASNNIKSEQ